MVPTAQNSFIIFILTSGLDVIQLFSELLYKQILPNVVLPVIAIHHDIL